MSSRGEPYLGQGSGEKKLRSNNNQAYYGRPVF